MNNPIRGSLKFLTHSFHFLTTSSTVDCNIEIIYLHLRPNPSVHISTHLCGFPQIIEERDIRFLLVRQPRFIDQHRIIHPLAPSTSPFKYGVRRSRGLDRERLVKCIF